MPHRHRRPFDVVKQDNGAYWGYWSYVSAQHSCMAIYVPYDDMVLDYTSLVHAHAWKLHPSATNDVRYRLPRPMGPLLHDTRDTLCLGWCGLPKAVW
jgi:hypothetical protein